MQDVLDVPHFIRMAERHVSDVLDWVCQIVSSLIIAGSLGLSHILEPFFMACHLVGGV